MIRIGTKTDLPTVRQCALDAYSIYVKRMGRKPAPMVADFDTIQTRGDLYVVEAEGVIVGFIVFYPKDGAMHLENVAVSPSAHGSGYGVRLIEFAESAARDQGFKNMELYTNEKMTENISYYLQLGYVEVARRNEDGFNRVYFRKEL